MEPLSFASTLAGSIANPESGDTACLVVRTTTGLLTVKQKVCKANILQSKLFVKFFFVKYLKSKQRPGTWTLALFSFALTLAVTITNPDSGETACSQRKRSRFVRQRKALSTVEQTVCNANHWVTRAPHPKPSILNTKPDRRQGGVNSKPPNPETGGFQRGGARLV